MVLTIRNFWSLLVLDLEMKGLDQMFAKVLSALLGRFGVWPSHSCVSRTVPRLHTDFRGSQPAGIWGDMSVGLDRGPQSWQAQ